jgi:hypothetical protein
MKSTFGAAFLCPAMSQVPTVSPGGQRTATEGHERGRSHDLGEHLQDAVPGPDRLQQSDDRPGHEGSEDDGQGHGAY